MNSDWAVKCSEGMGARVRYAFVTAAPPTYGEDATLNSYAPKLVIKDFCGLLDSAISDSLAQQEKLEQGYKSS
ncbi:hypothetical protein EYC80_005226 [Monilinia laxa]|uniref:Uncharacterized protein n=1 Tax=Monilinia laxa TaxID=61186 RepID=A0A5N6KJ89_MONLA|nr:hypothetical protein EYC80_005226 [Monilinia laxa]